jgi:hypothetical protein
MKKYVFVIAITVVFLGFLFTHATQAEENLNNTSECVVQTAIAAGYAGDPYSKDAWITFLGACTTPAE